MNSPIATSPLSSPESTFAACVDGRVPRPLREDAETKTFDAFVGEYSAHAGPVRLGQWSCVDGERPSGRLGPQARAYQATLALGDRIGTARAAACGPVATFAFDLEHDGAANLSPDMGDRPLLQVAFRYDSYAPTSSQPRAESHANGGSKRHPR